jgi:hypothetical protein
MAVFQRGSRWDHDRVVECFESVLRGYPIGSFVVMQGPAPEEEVLIGERWIQAPAVEDAWTVIDGAQRINALVGAILVPGEIPSDRRLQVFYDIDEGSVTGEPAEPGGSPRLPVAVATDSEKLLLWLRDRPWLSQRQTDACYGVGHAINSYTLPLQVVRGDPRQLATVFERINTSGRQLTKSEVEHARETRLSDDGEFATRNLKQLVSVAQMVGFGVLPYRLVARCVRAVALDDGRPGGSAPPGTRPQATPLVVDRTRRAYPRALRFLQETGGIPHFRLLPQPEVLPVLTRFAGRFGSPEGRAAELLRRWIWRSAALGDAAAPALSGALGRSAAEAVGEADRLLALLPEGPRPWHPDLGHTGLGSTAGRINALGLIGARPFSLLTDEQAGLMSTGVPLTAQDVLGPWLDRRVPVLTRLVWEGADGRPWADSLANYVFHPQAPPDALLDAVRRSPCDDEGRELLAGHCLDERCVELLRAHRYDEFAEHRTRLVVKAVADRVQSSARWGFRDGRGLPSLNDSGDRDEQY